ISSRPHTQANSVSGTSLDPDDTGTEQDFDAFSSENAPDLVGDVGILALQQLRSMGDDGHATPEAPVSLGELQTDIPAAENDEVLGHTVELEELDIRQRPGIR